jgi:hypothetical protein
LVKRVAPACLIGQTGSVVVAVVGAPLIKKTTVLLNRRTVDSDRSELHKLIRPVANVVLSANGQRDRSSTGVADSSEAKPNVVSVLYSLEASRSGTRLLLSNVLVLV